WTDFPWGGAFGESTTVWLKAFMGFFGVLMSLLFILAATIVVQFNPTIQWKGEFLAFPKIKMPAWKLSWAELGLDFFKKKKLVTDIPVESTAGEGEEILLDEEEDDETLQPGFLSRFLEENPEEEEEELDEEEDIDDLDLDPDFEPKREAQPTDAHDLEIEGLPDPNEIADNFSEGHIPSTFSGVEDKVFLMDQENKEHSEPYDSTLDLSSYRSPEIELLLDYPDEKIQIDRAEVEANKDQIIETLLNYKIEITKIRATIGPTVTLYEIIPKPGIRISKIKNLEDDIALSLSALGIRIIAPIPGKGTIGIEVPNKRKQIVSLK
ncbi:MAG TPA: DNA translocase FtsK, partial [Saprospiraceae bacterium]|nr:DNA translocase FtsK [Saprospiraceae bacterium]